METDKLTEIDPKKVENLHKLLAVFDTERLTPTDFIGAFKQVIAHVRTTHQAVLTHLAAITAAFKETQAKLEADNENKVSALHEKLSADIAANFAAHKTQVDQTHTVALARLDDAIAQAVPGKDADEEDIFQRLVARIPSPALGEDFRNALEALQEEDRLDPSAIRGLIERLDAFENQLKSHSVVIGNTPGSGIADSTGNIGRFSYLKFPGATITHQDDTASISLSSSGSSVYGEVPTDSGDHTNFTIAHTPVAGSFRAYRGGSRQTVTADYTQTGTALLLSSPLATGELLIVDYNY